MSTERSLATALARELEGHASGSPEAAALAGTLAGAAGALQLEVPEPAIERALAAARPRLAARPRRSRGRLLPAGLAAAALAVAIWLWIASAGSGPAVDVQARAISALPRGAVIMVEEQIQPGPGGGFPGERRTEWYAPNGDARWTLRSGGALIGEGLRAGGRLTVYDPRQGSAVVAAGCRAIGSGCAQFTDPVAAYRAALVSSAPGGISVTGRPGGYQLELPVQRAPGGRAIDQLVRIDGTTFLPTGIAWVDRGRVVARIRVISVHALPASQVPAGVFRLALPPGTRVRQVASGGAPVRLVREHAIGHGRLRALGLPAYWLGPRYAGHAARIALLRYTTGPVVQIRYGRLTLWSYRSVVPPALLANRLVPLKQLPQGNLTAQLYSTVGGRLVEELQARAATIAIEGPRSDVASLLLAGSRLRRL